MQILVNSGEKQQNVVHHVTMLYYFDIQSYEKFKEEGMDFSVE
jgi:hypothetical protein